MRKYIIELEDKPFHKEDGDFLYRAKGFNSLVFDMTGISKLTPYTEPDLEQVRTEAYQEGKKQAKVQAELDVCHDIENVAKENYKAGLSDAWEAVRKIADMPYDVERKIFNCADWDIVHEYTAAEAIKKLKAYEQEHEEIKVGDEVENTQTGVKFIVTHLWKNNRDEQGVSGFNHECSAFSTTLSLVVKTGRHFPEIATVLEKMRENT